MRWYYAIVAASLLLLTGCTPEIRPENLNPEEKRLIYQNVQDDIGYYTVQGEVLYADGYYAEAANAYEMVNFYEDRAVIPMEKIRKIRLRANANGKHYYNRALSYLKTDKKKALHEFNKMMRNNPDYKDGKKRFDTLKRDPEIREFMAVREKAVQKALLNASGKPDEIKKINAALEKLIHYDDANPVALQAKEYLTVQRNTLLHDAVVHYNKMNLTQATKIFRLVQSVYKKDATAEKYLARIFIKEELARTLKTAQDALTQERYEEAIRAAEKALDLDSKNSEARRIVTEAKLAYEKLIPALLEKGKAYYGKQDLENALKAFQAVLIWDPDDNTSLTYIRKIEQQIETIKSLK
jgi:tetratricopeptide (TPR) repeat protein